MYRVNKACFAELWDMVPHIGTMQERTSETVLFGSYGLSLILEELMKTAMLYRSRDNRSIFSLSWTNFLDDWLIGPYDFPSRLMRTAYHNFLIHILPDLVENELERIWSQVWFLKSGVHASNLHRGREHVNQVVGEKWTVRKWHGLHAHRISARWIFMGLFEKFSVCHFSPWCIRIAAICRELGRNAEILECVWQYATRRAAVSTVWRWADRYRTFAAWNNLRHAR
jgi:hypothetical protein